MCPRNADLWINDICSWKGSGGYARNNTIRRSSDDSQTEVRFGANITSKTRHSNNLYVHLVIASAEGSTEKPMLTIDYR